VWGSTETNVENWKAVKPLRNHDSGKYKPNSDETPLHPSHLRPNSG